MLRRRKNDQTTQIQSSCEITFENNLLKVFKPGEWMRGNVCLKLHEERKVRGVYVRIWGRAYARDKGLISFHGQEDFIDKKIYLVGGEDREIRLTPFEYFYKFSCQLPNELPTSFEGKVGHIRYTASVVLEVPYWINPHFEVAFTVIRPVDLNLNPAIREPSIIRETYKFWPYFVLFCSPSDPVEIIARTPFGGYVSGQIISMDIKIHNKSNQGISELSIKLIQKIQYSNLILDGCCPIYKKNIEKFTVNEQNVQGCRALHSNIIYVNLAIPPIPPTDTSSSKIVQISYYVEIIGSVSFGRKNVRVRVPIIIGTHPIENTEEAEQSNIDNNNQSDSNQTTIGKCVYEEALPLGKKSNKNLFRPLYPVYKNSYSTDV